MNAATMRTGTSHTQSRIGQRSAIRNHGADPMRLVALPALRITASSTGRRTTTIATNSAAIGGKPALSMNGAKTT